MSVQLMRERQILQAMMEENERQESALEQRQIENQANLGRLQSERQANNRQIYAQRSELSTLASELDRMKEKLGQYMEQLETEQQGKCFDIFLLFLRHMCKNLFYFLPMILFFRSP